MPNVAIDIGSFFEKTTEKKTGRNMREVAKPFDVLTPELLKHAFPSTKFALKHVTNKPAYWAIYWKDGPSIAEVKIPLQKGVRIPPIRFSDEPDFSSSGTCVRAHLIQFTAEEMPGLKIVEFPSQKERSAAIITKLSENYPTSGFNVKPIISGDKECDILSIQWINGPTEEQIGETLRDLGDSCKHINVFVRNFTKEVILEAMGALYEKVYLKEMETGQKIGEFDYEGYTLKYLRQMELNYVKRD